MKKYAFILFSLLLISCLNTPKATIVSAVKTDFAQISSRILFLRFMGKIDSSTNVQKIPDSVVKQSLQKMNVNWINVNYKNQYAEADSVISYYQKNKYISVRLYAREKLTVILYDFSSGQRDLLTSPRMLNTSAKKIGERLYIYSFKQPGNR